MVVDARGHQTIRPDVNKEAYVLTTVSPHSPTLLLRLSGNTAKGV